MGRPTRLTESDKLTMIDMYNKSEGIRELAEQFKVCTVTIYAVLKEYAVPKRKTRKPYVRKKPITRVKKPITREYHYITVHVATPEYTDYLVDMMNKAYTMYDTSDSVIEYGLKNFERLIKEEPYVGEKFEYKRVKVAK